MPDVAKLKETVEGVVAELNDAKELPEFTAVLGHALSGLRGAALSLAGHVKNTKAKIEAEAKTKEKAQPAIGEQQPG